MRHDSYTAFIRRWEDCLIDAFFDKLSFNEKVFFDKDGICEIDYKAVVTGVEIQEALRVDIEGDTALLVAENTDYVEGDVVVASWDGKCLAIFKFVDNSHHYAVKIIDKFYDDIANVKPYSKWRKLKPVFYLNTYRLTVDGPVHYLPLQMHKEPFRIDVDQSWYFNELLRENYAPHENYRVVESGTLKEMKMFGIKMPEDVERKFALKRMKRELCPGEFK